MNIYICITCIYICICIYIYKYIYICIYTHTIWSDIYKYICICIKFIYVYMYVYVYYPIAEHGFWADPTWPSSWRCSVLQYVLQYVLQNVLHLFGEHGFELIQLGHHHDVAVCCSMCCSMCCSTCCSMCCTCSANMALSRSNFAIIILGKSTGFEISRLRSASHCFLQNFQCYRCRYCHHFGVPPLFTEFLL